MGLLFFFFEGGGARVDIWLRYGICIDSAEFTKEGGVKTTHAMSYIV